MTNGSPSTDEVSGAALAAYTLSVNAVRLLKENGILSQDDVNALFWGILSSLERSELAADPSAHAARSLLSAAAQSQGVPLRQQN